MSRNTFELDIDVNVTDAKQGYSDHMKTLGKYTLRVYNYVVAQAEMQDEKGFEGWDKYKQRFLPAELKSVIPTQAQLDKVLKSLEYVGLIISRQKGNVVQYRPRTQEELNQIGYQIGLSDYLQKNAKILEQMRRDMGDEMFEKLSKAADQIDDDWFYGELAKTLNLK